MWTCDNTACRVSCHSECMFERVIKHTDISCPGNCGKPISIADRDDIIYTRARVLVEDKELADAENAELKAKVDELTHENVMLRSRVDVLERYVVHLNKNVTRLEKRNAELEEKLEEKDKLILELGLVDTARLTQDYDDLKQDYDDLKERFVNLERSLKESMIASEAQIRMLINRLDNK